MIASRHVSHLRSRRWTAILAMALASCGGDSTQPGLPGSVSVTVGTTGTDADSDGYTVTLGSEELPVGPSGSVTFEGLTPGSHEVSLGGVAANCTVTGGSTASTTVAEGEVAAVTFAVVCESVLATGAFTDAVCPDLSFPATSASPLERLLIGSVPEELEDPLFAHVTWSGGDDVAISFVDRGEDGSLTLVAPYHPSGELGGGEVSIRIGGGTQACPAVAFAVDGLPAAPGELAGTVDLMQELIEAQAARVGVTVAELQALDGTTLPAVQILPLLVAQSVVDHPANPNSLRALVDGTAPALAGADLTAADGVLAGIGFRRALADALTEIGPTPTLVAGRVPARADALDCLVTEVTTAQRLHDCMVLSYDAAFRIDGVSGEVLSDIAFASGVVGQVNNPATTVAAYATGGLTWAFQKLREGTANLLPSEFVSMELDAAPAEFLEDEESSGTWSAEARATSKGWELDQAVLESLSQIAGGLGAYGAWLHRFMGADEAVDLAGFITGEVVSNAIATSGGAGILVIPPESFGPVDVSDEEWSDHNLIPETRLTMTSHNVYEPRASGPTTLSVRTKDGMFGGAQIAEQAEINVGQIQINILPDDITLAPGQDTMLVVTVANSAHPDRVELHPDVTLQGAAEISYGTGDTHFVLYTAPADPPPGSVDVVTVRHTAESGARGYSEDERLDDATIRFAGIDLLPVQGCVAPEQEVQLEWELTGFETAPELEWTWSAGTVDGNGVFTAPAQEGTVTITVAVVDSPNLTDSIEVSVGECSCGFTLQVGSNPTYVGQPGDRVSYMAAEGMVPGEPYAIGSVSFEGPGGFSAVAGVEIPTVVVTGPGDYPLSTMSGGLGYGGAEDFFQQANPPRGTLRILQYEPHNALVGEVLGGVVEDAFDSGGPEFTFSATFQVYPPEGSLGWNYRCVIPDPPAE